MSVLRVGVARHRERTRAVLNVAPVSSTAARYAVEHWHYSRRLPVSPGQRYGVWEDGTYIGCILFCRGAAPKLGAAYGLGPFEVCELGRIALTAHVAPVSQIVPLAVAAVHRTSPGTRAVFSFADPYHGHHGGIYQAMNWTYLGVTDETPRWRTATGELLHNRVVAESGIVRQFSKMTRATKASDCEKIIVPGKHRYALGLDRGARRTLARYSQPYPTRGEGLNGEPPGNRSEGQVRSLGTAR